MNKKQHLQLKLPRPLSHSSITLYNECPQKYKFRYIDALPEKPRHYFSFGRSVHAALEFFYGVKTPVPPTLDELLRIYKLIWVAEGYRDQSQKDEYFEEGKRILTAFHEKHVKGFHVPLAVEYGFEIDVEGVPVKGFVDLIDRLPDGRLVVIDFKTGQGIAPGRVEGDPQLTMYQYACEILLGAEAGELILYHLPTLTEHRSPRHGDRLIDELKTRIVSTAEAISKNKFDPKPGEICRWCDYKPFCPIFKDQFVGVTPPAAPGLPATFSKPIKVAIDKIRANNPLQPRRKFIILEGHVMSIKQHGLAYPLIVSFDADSGFYELIEGERQWRAAQMAGLREVDVRVRQPRADGDRS